MVQSRGKQKETDVKHMNTHTHTHAHTHTHTHAHTHTQYATLVHSTHSLYGEIGITAQYYTVMTSQEHHNLQTNGCGRYMLMGVSVGVPVGVSKRRSIMESEHTLTDIQLTC